MVSFIQLFSLYFLIGFSSDLLLNYLSRQSYAPRAVKALKVYFDRKTIKSNSLRHFISAMNAGLTIIVALAITMLLSKLFLGFVHPNTIDQLWRFIILAFIIGYIADILIYKIQLFGDTLNLYYKKAGAGLWGAIAFIFSILVSYVLIKWAFKYF
jgi:hypothetical protein